MKKLFILLIAVLSAILMCLGFVACSSDNDESADGKTEEDVIIDVAGNTYVFESMVITYSDDFDDEDKMTEEDEEVARGYYALIVYAFNTDGTCVLTQFDGEADLYDTTLYYILDGKNIYFFDDEEELEKGDKDDWLDLRVDGDKLIYTDHDGGEGMVVTVTYKKK